MPRLHLPVGLLVACAVCGTAMLEGADKPKNKSKKAKKNNSAQAESKESEAKIEEQLRIFAAAMASLDQSYSFRGMKGDASFSAGSIFIDWQAKGVEPPQDVAITPPEPRDFSAAGKRDGQAPVPRSAEGDVPHKGSAIELPGRYGDALLGMPPRLVPVGPGISSSPRD